MGAISTVVGSSVTFNCKLFVGGVGCDGGVYINEREGIAKVLVSVSLSKMVFVIGLLV